MITRYWPWRRSWRRMALAVFAGLSTLSHTHHRHRCSPPKAIANIFTMMMIQVDLLLLGLTLAPGNPALHEARVRCHWKVNTNMDSVHMVIMTLTSHHSQHYHGPHQVFSLKCLWSLLLGPPPLVWALWERSSTRWTRLSTTRARWVMHCCMIFWWRDTGERQKYPLLISKILETAMVCWWTAKVRF